MNFDSLKQQKSRRTPFYYYDMALLNDTLDRLESAAKRYHYHVHYAMKANCNEDILKTIFKRPFGADCVSGNEVEKALSMGVAPNQIVLAGVGKSDWEIEQAIDAGIFCLNVESLHELQVIGLIAEKMGRPVKVALRLNPNVDANTHKHITTGLKENKFGIAHNDLGLALELLDTLDFVSLSGLHFHIGSQIMELQPYIDLCHQVNQILDFLASKQVTLEHLNLGGGLGINYHNPDIEPIPNFKLFFETIHKHLKSDLPVHFELGRSIVGQCGALVTRVLFEKQGASKNFLIVDAGMTELMRPALYSAAHKIERLNDETSNEVMKYSVVGPVCESTDSFGDDIALPLSVRGDVLVIRSAGAYGESMANNYNLRRLNAAEYSYDQVSVKDTL